MAQHLSSRPRSAWLWLCLLGASLPCVAARAEDAPASEDPPTDITTKFTINDDDPESSVPTPQQALRAPLEMGYQLMLLSERADAATKRGAHEAAAKYWKAIAKAVPERSLGFSRACQSYEAAGKSDLALEQCRSALGRSGATLEDNLRFVRLSLERPAISPNDVEDIAAIAAHLKQQLGGDKGAQKAAEITCQLGARISDLARLQSCTRELQKLAPQDPQTAIFAWTLAMKQGDLAQADSLVRQAQAAKLPDSALDRMRGALDQERDRRLPWWRKLRDPRTIALAFGVLLAIGGGVFALRGRRRQQLSQS